LVFLVIFETRGRKRVPNANSADNFQNLPAAQPASVSSVGRAKPKKDAGEANIPFWGAEGRDD